ncbi:hypothetical protein YM304_15340 [Ilumatobacter coccineus YM16-304]|uniref:Uncharacterized protein n=1 Tax=Ilumatobacter coccineus (strain NBRC 103263 / KCTC 29153 / YM16-304) TaxID=1313172 RepID=A0A6C7EB39_ILUCY|nr:hypothetical protein YM304_15340 [Ilumatobacter coccineus YM16-304]
MISASWVGTTATGSSAAKTLHGSPEAPPSSWEGGGAGAGIGGAPAGGGGGGSGGAGADHDAVEFVVWLMSAMMLCRTETGDDDV